MSSAETSLTLSPDAAARLAAADAFATARIAGIMAAKRVPDLIPLRQGHASEGVTLTIEATQGVIRIAAHGGAAIEAMTGAAIAALTLYDMAEDTGAVIGEMRLTDTQKSGPAPYRSAGSRNITARGERARPQVLMGEVASPRAGADARREAFRAFMTGRRLRPTTWAKDAGVSTGEIMGFLTGRSRGFSGDVAGKLARAARVSVEDMFR